jgi:uncharacterized protein (TIGR02391 family)
VKNWLKIVSRRQIRSDIVQVNFSEIIKLLWEEGFFKTEKTFKEIKDELTKQEYNSTDSTIYSAIKRANFLSKKGSVGHYRYIQKCKSHNNRTSDPKIVSGSTILSDVGIHPRIIKVSGQLFTDGHYSLAIFEAFKGVNNYVKEKSGLTNNDGRDLMAQAFKLSSPKLRWSKLLTESEKNEQEGFMLLFMGAIVGIRNPKAHDHVVQMDKVKTIEYLAFASLLIKRVDEAEKL